MSSNPEQPRVYANVVPATSMAFTNTTTNEQTIFSVIVPKNAFSRGVIDIRLNGTMMTPVIAVLPTVGFVLRYGGSVLEVVSGQSLITGLNASVSPVRILATLCGVTGNTLKQVADVTFIARTRSLLLSAVPDTFIANLDLSTDSTVAQTLSIGIKYSAALATPNATFNLMNYRVTGPAESP